MKRRKFEENSPWIVYQKKKTTYPFRNPVREKGTINIKLSFWHFVFGKHLMQGHTDNFLSWRLPFIYLRQVVSTFRLLTFSASDESIVVMNWALIVPPPEAMAVERHHLHFALVVYFFRIVYSEKKPLKTLTIGPPKWMSLPELNDRLFAFLQQAKMNFSTSRRINTLEMIRRVLDADGGRGEWRRCIKSDLIFSQCCLSQNHFVMTTLLFESLSGMNVFTITYWR